MKKISETIVFFGSGPVAARSLELLSGWINIEAVITKPQPEHHKETFPVLAATEYLGIKTYTPENKTALSELINSTQIQSRIGVVIDYGFIINQDVIDHFPLGIVNSHFSLLPEWRGADPITFSILSGQEQTGISLMLITAGMDEGPLLAQATYDMRPDIAAEELTQDLIDLSNQTLKVVLPEYLAGSLKAIPQSGIPTYSHKLAKQDGELDWNKPAEQLEREVRAYHGWPKSYTTVAGKKLIITKAHAQAGNNTLGSVRHVANSFGFYTKKGVLVVDAIKPAGKSEMSAQAFLAGYGKDL